MSTSEQTLSKMFCQAGELISSHIVEHGVSPQKTFTNVWNHKNGYIEFDGSSWSFFIHSAKPQADFNFGVPDGWEYADGWDDWNIPNPLDA